MRRKNFLSFGLTKKLERFWSNGWGLFLGLMLALGLSLTGTVNGAAFAQSSSGQTHMISGQQVFCETTMRGRSLVVLCSSSGVTHLVIVQRNNGLVAYPLTRFGATINQAAYGYRLGNTNGITTARQLLMSLGL